MSVRRVYVEKKPEFAVKAGELKEEISSYLSIDSVTKVRVLIRYDIENLSDETYQQAVGTIFSEPPVDFVYEESFPQEADDTVFSVEYLPGQFDQRADSAEQCVKLLKETEEPVIRTATTYVLSGSLSDEQKTAIKSFCINPVDSREAGAGKPQTLVTVFDVPEDVTSFDGFRAFDEENLNELYSSLNLAMTFKDFQHIQTYYQDEEHRDPTVTEIRVLDTYWSDHCRHTTFSTELKDVTITEGDYKAPIEETYKQYLADREVLYKGRDDKFVCLMDLALLAMKKLRAEGKLEDLEVSDEINACSIVVPVTIDGVEEEWLVNFKNETHNHPTEIEPFGGAATCLGGAIRDPLSGRTYVYQAMRVTGAADPTRPLSETLKGKLPQRKLVNGAASGYSSYGNQIGLATGYVKELYHPNYVAKRMEIGAVMGAAPRKQVKRLNSDPGDIIVLLGGRTGRDGIGGATGSSKVHTEASIEVCGAEVQKGNAPTERKIQRLFRRAEVSNIIKKCNDFGAGGVSVAIGELAAGLQIDMDKVPKKYAGLDGTEIAISESQERMAVVLDPADVDKFLAYSAEENLEAIPVAVVTEEPRLVMNWRGKTIVDVSRAFLDTNGAHQEAKVVLETPVKEGNLFERKEVGDVKATWLNVLADLNVCSQKGLVEMFDGSIGAGSVFMPYGGKYQLTETQAMVAKLPVLKGKTDTVTMMSYGFDPYLSSWSPYHGSIYAVLSSVAKIVANGGDYSKIRFTFQEYFKRMTEDAARWGAPFAALLGAYNAQLGFGLPSIGGKDSMSGTFNDEHHGEINVPPTLVSFAVDVASDKTIISPEFKKAGSKIVVFQIEKDQYDLPVYSQIMDGYTKLHEDIKAGRIISAYAVEGHGMAEAVSKMAFGNKLGVKIEHNVDPRDFFAAGWGNIVCEVPDGKVGELAITYTVIGEVTDKGTLEYGPTTITMDEALHAWNETLEDVFPTQSGVKQTEVTDQLYKAENIHICTHKLAQPTVFIPVFPGTNCEYDSTKAFERAGARVVTRVFKNLSAEDIRESVEGYKNEISQAQIVMFPGGFSAGDEPEGSAKFFATVFRNAVIKEEIDKLLNERDGLMLGICNGFQALIKLGLVPEGTIAEQTADSPTLAMNTIGRHISKMVYTKVVTNKSPWLQGAELGGVYCNPASHGEGRFVANDAWLKKLFENGQVATQYVDDAGKPTMDEFWNPNGSYMAIEGITSPDGRILGKMAHSERRGDSVAMNIYGEQDMKIFESGVKYFK
ncbi:MAG: phosphoribosylformylglycinamidine synthase [Lachnospiraceae bacterium]|nr:phosphoribosylformylglycinamidine synthase [Lachnospiraceae bacterium]